MKTLIPGRFDFVVEILVLTCLKGMDTFARAANLSETFCLPEQQGFSFEGRNLLIGGKDRKSQKYSFPTSGGNLPTLSIPHGNAY